MPTAQNEKILLVGGGVSVAPLLYFGQQIKEKGGVPTFLFRGASRQGLAQLDYFKKLGRVLSHDRRR